MRRIILPLLITTAPLCHADDSVQNNADFNMEFINGNFNKNTVNKVLHNGLNDKAIYSVQINGKTVGDVYFVRDKNSLKFDEDFYQQKLVPQLQQPLLDELHQTMAFDLGSATYSVKEKTESSTLAIWFKDTDVQHGSDNRLPLSDSINNLVLNYNLSPNYFVDRDNHNAEGSIPINGHASLNLHHFLFNLDVSSTDLASESLTADNLSVSHLLPALQSELTAGQTYSSSRYSAGYNFYGMQLNSVDDLFSRRDRYYTPSIIGNAKTNATVEVYQGKRLLFSKTVAAGQFVIDEVQGLSNQTLRVVVKESDGTQNTFFYENTVVPGLLTPGVYSYVVNAGKYRYGDNQAGDAFASSEYSHGFNWFTGTVSALFSGDYRNITVGGSLPLQSLGALGLSASDSAFQFNGRKRSGQSYSINYAKYLNNNFNLQLAGYRYSTRGYLAFNEAMDIKRTGIENYATLRNRFTASIMAKEPILDNQVSVNITRSNYWSATPTTTTYALNYGGFLHRASYSLSMAKSYNQYYGNETSYSLTLTVPFGSDGKNIYTRYNNTRYNKTAEVGLNSYGRDGAYSVSAARDFAGDNTVLNGTYGWNTDRYSSQLSASAGNHTAYASGSVSGSLAVADKHLIASSSQASTLALVNFEGAEGASINGVKVQPNGYALVPLNDRFDEQSVSVDTESLANNIQLKDTQVNLRPRSGEMALIKFTSKKVKFIRAVFMDSQGQPLSFGSGLTRQDTGEDLFVGNGGGALLQKSLVAGKKTEPLVLRSTDTPCIYRVSSQQLMNRNDENQDFIDVGELSCQK
jgi:outer membrane usher protein FimD/PapC